MIKILKASAGSGKTFNLAKTYIKLLLENPDPQAYRHILAVTFTNKATDEMKGRILRELHLLSTEPEKSPYSGDFIPGMFSGLPELKRKAGAVLLGILHDYSAFAISTIDRFFQQTLKAFSREIGQFASYQVELDKDSLVAESVDRILDSLTEDDKALLGWLSDSMMERLEQGRRFSLEGSLTDMAGRLKSDEHRSVLEENGIEGDEAYSKENLIKMKKRFREVMEAFVSEIKAAAKEVEDAFASCGVSPSDTSRGFMGSVLEKFAAMDSRSPVPKLTDSFRNKAADYGSWFKKADQGRYACHEGILAPTVAKFVAKYDSGIKVYNTAGILMGQIGDLGIASDLNREFQNLLKEKNVLSLDDSNMILRNIIDGSDAPFIYEKLGVRYEHFLLDEFQDTSRVQWDNLKPLIANSDSQGFENLLVGDVKQSIYRWRGSDWKLMAREVGERFRGAVEDRLEGNWRSLKNLVDFNNSFFPFAAETLDNLYGEGAEISVSSIYGKGKDGFEKQEVMLSEEGEEGSVEAVFCDPDAQMERILGTIRKVLGAGAVPGDITILTRNNQDGSDIATFLMGNGIDVISDDSLRLKSSFIVRKLVSLISSVKDPTDTIGSYLAGQSHLDPGAMDFHSLTDLCERLIRVLQEGEDKEAFEGETLYVQSFMDYVQDYTAANGNSLDSFLKAWDESDPKVSSPSDTGAVRIMTIHKAKGLEFPYVIFPYSEKVGLFRPRSAWAVPKVEGTPLEGIGKAAFDVTLSSGSETTLFGEDYQQERLLQYIDNINTYYVALTRASKGMTIISSESCRGDKDFGGILLRYLESKGEDEGFTKMVEPGQEVTILRKGKLYDFRKMDRKGQEIGVRKPGYPSFPLNMGTDEEGHGERGRLKISAESSDFFTEEGIAAAMARQNGTALHDILSRVRVPSDLEASVRLAVDSGDLESTRFEEVTSLLSSRISRHPEWFLSEGAEVLNEVSLIDTDGREWRPDRVVIRDGSVTVIDYKFGERNSAYRRQVARYAYIYRRLGHEDVRPAIWYVFTDEVE